MSVKYAVRERNNPSKLTDSEKWYDTARRWLSSELRNFVRFFSCVISMFCEKIVAIFYDH